MKTTDALLSGLAGATALTVVHEGARRVLPNAPRMDLLGMQALTKLLHKADKKAPDHDTLFGITMAGDLISNTLYYSVAGISTDKNVVYKSIYLGLAAGIGAVTLPKPLGLSEAPSKRTTATAVATIALYTLGGLVAGITMKLMQKRKEPVVPDAELVL